MTWPGTEPKRHEIRISWLQLGRSATGSGQQGDSAGVLLVNRFGREEGRRRWTAVDLVGEGGDKVDRG